MGIKVLIIDDIFLACPLSVRVQFFCWYVECRVGFKIKQLMREEDLYKDRDSQIAAIEHVFECAQSPVGFFLYCCGCDLMSTVFIVISCVCCLFDSVFCRFLELSI